MKKIITLCLATVLITCFSGATLAQIKQGTITELQAGDVACYVSLKDNSGRTYSEMADFSICEQENLVGKNVTLTYTTANVMADSCNGNPDCKETKVVQIISKADIVDKVPTY